jgi:polysaccharide deacetylase 2 family uncharacterized protein YibQ
MENTFSKTLLHCIFFTTLIVSGYIVGLITFPAPKPIVAVKHATMSIENAENKPQEDTNETDFPAFQAQEVNPFNGGKILNIPQRRTILQTTNNQDKNSDALKQDRRITSVTQTDPLNENPMGYVSDKVEIQISGEQPLSQIETKNIIDDLSVMSKKRTQSDATQEISLTDPYAPRTPLAKSPQNAYMEKTPFGILPKSPTGQTPLWQVYANPTSINPNKKPIAYIVGGLGNDYKLTLEAIKTLPSEVTLGFIPYVNNLQAFIDMAREYGHETILEIPMESHDFPRPDAGLLALEIKDDAKKYRDKLQTLLSRATGYSGVMNYLGSKYLLDGDVSKTLLNDLKQYGLYFVENKTMRTGILSDIAYADTIPYGASQEIIDEVLSPSIINMNFSVIEKAIIATTYLSPLSLSLLKARLLSYQQNNNNDIQLIPISASIKAH